MSRLNRILLWQEFWKMQPRSTNPAQRLIQPSYDHDWSTFSSVRINFFIRQINGAPTAWALKPRLEIGITSTNGFQDVNAFWKTLTPTEAAAMTREGAWLPDLDQTATLPGMWSVTIVDPPAAMRINFGESGATALTMTGGTSPSIQAACVAYPKGH